MKKKTALKVISIVLCLILVTGIAAPMALGSNGRDVVTWCDVPVVYIHGQGDELYRTEEDGSRKLISQVTIPDGYIESFLTEENIKMFAKCYFTNDYTEFENLLVDAYVPLYEDIKLGKDGLPLDNSAVMYDCSDRLWNRTSGGKYELEWYEICYDWRQDPYTTADKVNDWVLRLCEVTGRDKVALLGRCLGASVMTAYLEKYGFEHISDIVMYTSVLDGSTPTSRAYGGNLYVDEYSLERYLYDVDLSGFIPDETVVRFIRAFVTAYNKIGGVKWALNEVNRVYKMIGHDTTGRLLRESYGTFPGFWAMVEDKDYEQAKQICFGGQEVQWAELIKKIDHYHYSVMVRSDEIFKAAADAGVNIYSIQKYGYQEIPVTELGHLPSDGVVELQKATKGATVMPIGSKFDDDYIASAFDAGTAKYISCDRTIDASTCMFKDTTWMIKNIDHMNFDYCIDELICKALDSNGKMTVFSDPDFPQYMVYEPDTRKIVPMTDENCNTTYRWDTDGWEAFRFVIFNFKYVLDYVLDLLNIDLF